MLTVQNLYFQFGKRLLFNNVSIKFTKGNCYGIIGANGSGKSTFLKIISGEQKPTKGKILVESEKRISFLKQDHNNYNNYTALETVIMGNIKLFKLKKQINNLYKKKFFSEKDGLKAAELGVLFEEINGWNSEKDASILLSNLGIKEYYHNFLIKNLENKLKIKVLLAQAIFGNPDVLILDEPTNDLDVETIYWLENFLSKYENTVIVVSHDRHLLDSICTHICDIDFGNVNLFTGNYSFWYKATQIAIKQNKIFSKKIEEKKKKLENFILRFSSNASKARQATSRKKILKNLNLKKKIASSRRYPYICFEQEREVGDQILNIKNLSKKINKKFLLKNISFNLKKGDKIALFSNNSNCTTVFYEIITGNLTQDSGKYQWGTTVKYSYLPLNNFNYFNNQFNLIEWLNQFIGFNETYSEENLRSFLGKMLFSGEETFKKVKILSGGEKMRCLFAMLMLLKGNVLILDEPTNHLDLEAITSLNKALKEFKGNIIITSRDQKLLQTVCNNFIEITDSGTIINYHNFEAFCNYKKKFLNVNS
ncbi:ABC-F family ATP-binding cassette domain-containing protein [Candidatus Karelsulcia muelleri]|uniref:ABC-F family ATP-binding cassette domain-containing protein n=1 Tax=Candidatus Karelsulcia muelleri TaxID=336810 RepID=UPI000D7CCC8A|nr:ATP-binding cassette domain-containing protein [Candidatus Karelsulcia muelleri]